MTVEGLFIDTDLQDVGGSDEPFCGSHRGAT
jgi:hypothetical protein